MSTDKALPANLLDQINQIFTYYGFRSPSMDDIAKDLGISKKTLYKYAIHKEDVIIQSLTIQLTRFSDEPSNFNSLFDDLVSKLRLFTSSSIQDLKIYYPKAYEIYSDFRYQFLPSQLEVHFKTGQKQKKYNKNFSPKFLSQQLINWIENLLFNQIGDSDITNKELNELKEFVELAITKPNGN